MTNNFQAAAISLPGPFPEAIKAGLRKVGELLKTNETKSALLLVPHIGQFDATVIAEVLGDQATKELKKHRTVNLGDGVTLSLHSPETISGSFDEILIVYVSSKEIERSLKGLYGFRSVTYVPWLAKERDWFISTYQADLIEVADPRSEDDKSLVDEI